jgi:imidazolonepropionase-like amidohydrolase
MNDFVRRLLSISMLVFLTCVQSTNPQSTAKPVEMIVLVNVTVIDGEGGPPKPNMSLVISGGRIVDMFRSGSKKPSAGAQVIDLSNHYVIPGLIDSHYHFMLGLRSKEEEEALRRYAFLGGITTVRDMAGDAIALAELARLAANRDVQSPRVYFSALMAGPTHLLNDKRVDAVSHGLPRGEAPWLKAITPQTDIVKAISEAKATGATGIKIYTDLTPEIVARLTAEAHKQGLKVWSHAAIYPGRPSDAVRAGVDVISHSNLAIAEAMEKVPQRYAGSYLLLDYNSYGVESKAISELLQLMVERGTFLDPTLVVTDRLGKTEPGKIFRDPVRMAEWSYQFTMRAHIRRIPIVAGTDINEAPTTREFPNIHTEMEMLVDKAGLTPLEAITAATRNGAQVLGIAKSYGTIATGKVANLVVLSADPSKDIRNTTKVVYVIKGGKLHKR